MKTSGFNATTRQFAFWLPIFMGVIEYIMRVGFRQPGRDEFFPISLLVAGIALCVALTSLPKMPAAALRKDGVELTVLGALTKRFEQESRLAHAAVFLTAVGVLLWIYVLAASFSDEVKAILPFYPLTEAAVYYIAGVLLTEWKARIPDK